MTKSNCQMKNKIHFKSLLAEAKAKFSNLEFTPDCPIAETIVDYVYDDLSSPMRAKVTEHITECESCRILALKIEADRTELEQMIDQSPDKFLGEILGSSRDGNLIGKKMSDLNSSLPSLSQIKKATINWVSPLWEPKFAGQVVTAAGITEQTKRFELDYGEYVNVSCHWAGGRDDQIPYLQLTWKANFHTHINIWIRFIDPLSNNTISEFCLGSDLEGSRQLSVEDLEFDPTIQRWAISIVTENI